MKYTTITSVIRRAAVYAVAVIAALSAASCDSMIYDEEGDCDPHYKVRFKYDRNLKYSDAFAAEVKEVTLYVVDDATGKVIWQKHESGEQLRSGSYLMDVDVEPGTYTLVAWCGEGHTSSFSVADAEHYSGLQCRLLERGEHPGFDFEGSAVRKDLGDLYHGKLTAQKFPNDQGTHVYTIDLTKDTNYLHIVLQHLSGDPVEEEFTFTIVEENGFMDWDNSLLPDEQLTYYAHTVRNGYAGVDVPDYRGDGEGNESRAITAVSACVADLTMGRLMADRKSMVRIYNPDKELVASIPLQDYALMTKGKHSQLSDQDYLDYRDDYSMVLFLDDNGRWFSSTIYINSWMIVKQTVG